MYQTTLVFGLSARPLCPFLPSLPLPVPPLCALPAPTRPSQFSTPPNTQKKKGSLAPSKLFPAFRRRISNNLDNHPKYRRQYLS